MCTSNNVKSCIYQVKGVLQKKGMNDQLVYGCKYCDREQNTGQAVDLIISQYTTDNWNFIPIEVLLEENRYGRGLKRREIEKVKN